MMAKPEQAAEWLYNLMAEKRWLISEKAIEPTLITEPMFQEMVEFFRVFEKHGADDWQDVSQSARATTATILADFMTKLMGGYFEGQVWKVKRSLPDHQKILQIILQEIDQNHLPQSTIH
jgi:hypothetical protein